MSAPLQPAEDLLLVLEQGPEMVTVGPDQIAV
jgi:hypothetical protein